MTADRSGCNCAHARPGVAGDPSWGRQLTLPAAEQAPALARQATRQVLTSWQVAHLEETAVLLLDELVTNVGRHAPTTSGMISRLQTPGTVMPIDVKDADTG